MWCLVWELRSHMQCSAVKRKERRMEERERGTKERRGSVLYQALRAFTRSDLFIFFGKNFIGEMKIAQISLAMWSLPLWDTHGLANERAFLVFLENFDVLFSVYILALSFFNIELQYYLSWCLRLGAFLHVILKRSPFLLCPNTSPRNSFRSTVAIFPGWKYRNVPFLVILSCFIV